MGKTMKECVTMILPCSISGARKARLLSLPLLVAVTFFLSGYAAEGPHGTKPAMEMLFEGNLEVVAIPARVGTPKGTITYVDGMHGACASFDGMCWVDTGFFQDTLGDQFTVECWVNPSPQQTVYADIFGNHVDGGAGFVLQQDRGKTNSYMACYGTGEGRWVRTDAITLTPGRWQHLALVKAPRQLQLYLKGVLATSVQTPAPVHPSPLPVAVGLGYTDEKRCFQGCIDGFRIWDKALDNFDHAGIQASEMQETSTLFMTATPRPAADRPDEFWAVATEDTHLSIGVTATGQMVVRELLCPAVEWDWIARPVAFRLPPHVEVGGQMKALKWQFVEAVVDKKDGQKVTLRFACDDPALEMTSQWHAKPGPGPIYHSLSLTNCSRHLVTVGEQPTFDLDFSGGTTLWRFHGDGMTPDPVGVYEDRLMADDAGSHYTARTQPTGGFIPYVVLDAGGQHGVYIGLEWSFCRIEAVTLDISGAPVLRMRAGNAGDLHAELAPGETLPMRPGFLGTYQGDLDDAGNRLRRWVFQYCVPEVLRQDTGYPKVQWNAFAATGKEPGSWDPTEEGYYPLIDDIAPLGFEEVMIDVGWWQGGEPDFDQADWPSGMRNAADYAHEHNMRFGLYWTDDLDMAEPAQRRQRADRIRRLFTQYGADIWRSDSTRGEVIGNSYAATRGFYEMVDTLASEIPGFQWENCSCGGRIKDYGAMRRAIKVFNSDTYSALHVRQCFHDSAYAMHPMQLEGHLGSVNGLARPQGVAAVRYAFRSTSMGAPSWFLDAPNGSNGTEPWTQQEKEALKACVATYKSRIRPLVRKANLYHISARPDGQRRDGIEYYDPDMGQGVVYLFQPSADTEAAPLRFEGLDPMRQYWVSFEDNSNPSCLQSGAGLMDPGLTVALEGARMSELIFFEATE